MELKLKNLSNNWNKNNNAIICRYLRGSRLYNTADGQSDNDYLAIVGDDVIIIPDERYISIDCIKADKRIYQTSFGNIDVEVVKYSDFISLIKEHSPLALEAIFSIERGMSTVNDIFLNFFELNKWKIRESFGSIANNSFVKAKKKLVVKESYDHRCAIKSLFHSIRLLMYACQIAENGKLIDFGCCKPLWDEIKTDADNGFGWEDFKKKYKPIWNEWHSKMVKLCPRPEEYFKNCKK